MATQKKRLDPTPSALRSLYVASGGVCEMTDCNKRLTRASGAWIGTVAHIVSAEDDGPRADSSMSPEERRKESNLMLLCADHGREVDDRLSGERDFPLARLEEIKRAHEERFADLVDEMITSTKIRPPAVDDFLDSSARRSVAPGSCEAFGRFLDGNQGTPDELAVFIKDNRRQLEHSRRLLSDLSEAALGTLAVLLDLWQRSLDRRADGAYGYGDMWAWNAVAGIPEAIVHNRERNQSRLMAALEELEQRKLLSRPPEELFDLSEKSYAVRTPWGREWTTWPLIACFLDTHRGLTVGAWVRSLDYAVFD